MGPLVKRPGLSPESSRSPRQAIIACFESALSSIPLAVPFNGAVQYLSDTPPESESVLSSSRLAIVEDLLRHYIPSTLFWELPLESGLLQVAVLGWLP